MEPPLYKQVAPANTKTVTHRPTALTPKGANNNPITLVEKGDFLTGAQKWLLFYTILGGTIIIAFTCDVPDWFQITGLVLLVFCWLPKTLWSHRAVFVENKMATFTTMVAVFTGIFYGVKSNLKFEGHAGLFAVLAVLGIMLKLAYNRLKKKHGEL